MTSVPLYHWKRFTLTQDNCTLPNGLDVEHVTLRHPGAVLIVPQADNGDLVMLNQYRPSIGKWILEFPAGTLEPNELVLDCAKRELAEEAWLAASEWTDLGQILPAPGFCNEVQYLYFAKGLSAKKAQRDDDEIIEIVSMSVDQVAEKIVTNEILDSKTISAFARATLSNLINVAC